MPLKSGAVTLLRTDGVMLARWPRAPDEIGKSVMSADVIARGLAKSQEGILRKISVSDHTARIYAYEKLKNYPLLIGVSISENQMYAAWRAKAWSYSDFA